jgi:protease I
MNPDRLAGFRVAILATDLFEEVELTSPRKTLEEAGATTVLIAPHGGEIQGAQHDRLTQKYKVDMLLNDADPAKFDALLLPGGARNSAALRKEPLALDFVRHMSQLRQPIAFICHGGWLLVAAKIVKGRHLTSYPEIKDDFVKAGAFWYDKEMVRDGNMVSSRKPADLPAFNQEMINLFVDHHLHSHAAA